jgi:hypothetical protein
LSRKQTRLLTGKICAALEQLSKESTAELTLFEIKEMKEIRE